MKEAEQQASDDRNQDHAKAIVRNEAELGGGHAPSNRPPSYQCCKQPLKPNGCSVKRDLFRSRKRRPGLQLLEAAQSAPGNDHGEEEKDQPEIPRHFSIRTLSAG